MVFVSNLNLPPHVSRVCPVCDGELTWYSSLQAMSDWQAQILRKQKDIESPPIIDFDGAHPVNTESVVMVADEKGRLFVPHAQLIEAGYLNLCDFDVVRLNGRFYELLSFMKKAGLWWVEEIDPEEIQVPDAITFASET